MSEMADRVEAAILREISNKPSKPRYRAAAIAAIKAMREPTPEMEQAYLRACDESGACLWRTAYRVMIDAATPAPPSPESK